MNWPHYSKAPIIEASISIGVVPSEQLEIEDLAAIGDIAEGTYTISNRYFYAGEVNVPAPGDPPQHEDVHGQVGYTLNDPLGSKSANLSIDEFEFSVGQPYDQWETFRDEARAMWDIYKALSKCTQITHVSLRYINQIDITETTEAKLDDYFRVYLEIPDHWPGGTAFQNFFVQFQTFQQDLDCLLVVNHAPAPSPNPTMVSVRLDFDLIKRPVEETWSVDRDDEIWEFLEQMRERKNAVFNGSITEKTKEMIR